MNVYVVLYKTNIFLHNSENKPIFAAQKEANHNKDYSVVKTFKAGESSLFLFAVFNLHRDCCPQQKEDDLRGVAAIYEESDQ